RIGEGAREGLRVGEVGLGHLDARGKRHVARVPDEGPHGDATRRERADELAADVAARAADDDHDAPSNEFTRVSPPVASTTAPVIWGWPMGNTGGGAMSPGVPPRAPGRASAPRPRSSPRGAAVRCAHISLSV